MRRKNVISRFTTLVLATLACLLLAVLAPMLFGPRATDEPFSGYAVMASPRDMHVVTAPIRLSDAPDLTLSRGTLYADGNAAAGTPISRFVLDAPVLTSTRRACAPARRTSRAAWRATLVDTVAPLLVEQLLADGLRRPDGAPGHAPRDDRRRDVGDDRRHRGGADRATQGP